MSSKRKVRFGCDIDGVIYRWDDTARYILQSKFGIDYLGDRSQSWDDIHDRLIAHGDENKWKWLWSDGITKHGLFRYGSIYKGAREFLTSVAEKCDIVVITSRPPLATLDTMEWLGYQRFPTQEVHIVRDRTGQKKSDIVPHADVYLDDGPHNIADLLEKTTDSRVMIMDRPWNQKFVPSTNGTATTFHRVTTWNQAIEIIDQEYERLNGGKGNES